MNLLFILKEGLISLKRARVSAFIAIISLSLSLTLIGLFGIVGQNVKDVFFKVYKQIELEVFIEPVLSESEISQLTQKIKQDSRIANVKFIPREKALAEFKKNFGEDISSVLDENPLPSSIRIIMDPAHSTPKEIAAISEKINNFSGVQEVLYQEEIVNFVHKYFSLAVIVSIFLAIILLGVITILIFNTIRLTIHNRMNIIQIMKLVGATNSFIKSPFIVEGMLQGFLGGLVASGIVVLFIKVIRNLIYPQLGIPEHLFSFLIGIGIIFGLVGSYLSVNKYLKY